MNREGTLHFVQISKASPLPLQERFQVGFADYASPGGAMRMKELVGEQGLRNFFTGIGLQPNLAEITLRGLRREGSASVLSVVLPEEMLISLGLANPRQQPVVSVRFTVFQQPRLALAYSLAGPFLSATFSNRFSAPYADVGTLVRALDRVGLPGREILSQSDRVYTVTSEQLTKLGLKPPAW